MPRTGQGLLGLIQALIVVGAMGMLANGALAAVNCAAVLDPAAPDITTDTDEDGFTDYQECSGITLAISGAPVPSCVAAGSQLERSTCMHPDSKDLFVIYATAAQGSLLAGGDPRTEIREPFKTVSAYGVTFLGLGALGVTIHQISPQDVGPDRTVTGLLEVAHPLLSAQKAVRVTEDLDNTGATLGYCQYGTPNGLASCTVYTRRILDFINATCTGLAIVQADGKTASDAESVFKAYTTHTILHEVGHAVGGLTPNYNSRYGGYHYSSGTVMEQYVVATTKGGKCKFAVSNEWNLSLDPPAVILNK